MKNKPTILAPEKIESESFRIIEEEIGEHNFPHDEFTVVRRVIHSSADFEFLKNIRFQGDAVNRGVESLKNGTNVVCDVQMIQAGIYKPRLEKFGGNTFVYISDDDVRKKAKEEGVTRAIISMRKAVKEHPNAVYAIGNAPTALFELIRLIEEEGAKPALVVGVPVGFVSAPESKDELIESGYPAITSVGRKGGTPVAVSIINALLALADSAK